MILKILGNIRKYCQRFSANNTVNTWKYWGCQGFCQDNLAQNQQILSTNAQNIGPNVLNIRSCQGKNSKYWESCQKYWCTNGLNIRSCQKKTSKYWESCQKYWCKNGLNIGKSQKYCQKYCQNIGPIPPPWFQVISVVWLGEGRGVRHKYSTPMDSQSQHFWGMVWVVLVQGNLGF